MFVAEQTAVRYERTEAVAIVTLDRASVLNAVDVTLAKHLGLAIKRAATDQGVRALLIKGAGRAFCAGGDVAKFDGNEPFSDVADRTMSHFHPAVFALSRLPIPTVAVVHGAVAGAGMSLMLACDFAVAAFGTRFTLV